MPGRTFRSLAFVAALVVTAGLVGCGGGKEDRSLLTSKRANLLRSSLDDVQQKVDNGDCQGAATAVLSLQQKVNALPARVDAGLRDALTSGASRLQQLVNEQCQPVGPTGPTLQAPEENNEDGQGKKGKGKAKGHDKNKHELPQQGTTGPTVPNTGGAGNDQ